MKTLLSFASSLFSSVGLSGCSAPTISDTRYLDVAGLSDYFAQVRDKAVAYFVCGQAVQKNPMFGDIDMTENYWCAFSINGQAYRKLNTLHNCNILLLQKPLSVLTPEVFNSNNENISVKSTIKAS